MISTYYSRLQPITNSIAKLFVRFDPNMLSSLSFIMSIPGFYGYATGNALLGSTFILGSSFDFVDGAVARMTGKASKFGGVLDATLDRFYDGLLLFFIGWGGLVSWPLVFVVFLTSVLISYIKAKAEASVTVKSVGRNQFSVGIAERTERLVIILIGSVLAGLFQNTMFLILAFWILLLLNSITIVIRMKTVYKVLK